MYVLIIILIFLIMIFFFDNVIKLITHFGKNKILHILFNKNHSLVSQFY
jgi:hypothetical protein